MAVPLVAVIVKVWPLETETAYCRATGVDCEGTASPIAKIVSPNFTKKGTGAAPPALVTDIAFTTTTSLLEAATRSTGVSVLPAVTE